MKLKWCCKNWFTSLRSLIKDLPPFGLALLFLFFSKVRNNELEEAIHHQLTLAHWWLNTVLPLRNALEALQNNVNMIRDFFNTKKSKGSLKKRKRL
jgi:hypothetical protein